MTVKSIDGLYGRVLPWRASILNAYPDLEIEDVRGALRYAAEAVRERILPVVGGS